MNTTELRETFEALLQADADVADRDELVELLVLSRCLRGWQDHVDIQIARRGRQLAEQGHSEPAGSLLGEQGRRSNVQAQKVADREHVGTDMGGFENALGDGKVSAEHLDAIAAATSGLDENLKTKFGEHEQQLLVKALTESVEVFTRRCRQLARRLVAAASAGNSDAEELDVQRERSCVKRWVDKITGMHHTHLELDPVRDTAVWSVIDNHLAKLRQTNGNARTPWQQIQVNAVVAAVETGANSGDAGDPGRRIPEATVLIDWSTLVSGMHDNTVCETEDGVSLPVSTVRRMCCDAEVLPAVLRGDSEILDVGRTKRTATAQQRRALRAMYRTCGHPDCSVGYSKCRIHHIKWWWEHHGPTNLNNLIPLCEKHHHMVHEGQWQLAMTPDRTTTWTRPDGIVAYTTKTVDRTVNRIGAATKHDDREFITA